MEEQVTNLSVDDFLNETEISTINKNVFIPSWDNRPPELPSVIKLDGTTILTHQNSAAIIANPGAGKSSAMEAIASSYLNPKADNLKFEVDPSCKGVLIIDTERTTNDVWNSFYRMCRRAGINEGESVNNVLIAGLRAIPRLKERRNIILSLLDSNPCSLLLIDGAGDLVTDTNDLEQAIESRIWIREITVKYNLSVLVTLHPNPGGNKPRGHQGSEICREAECVLLIKSHDDNTKIITTEFEQGKNRNNPKLTTAYTWSNDKMMFLSSDYENLRSAKDIAKKQDSEILAKSVLPAQTSLKRVELIEKIKDEEAIKETQAKARIKDMIDYRIIEKGSDQRYRLIV